MFCGNFATIRRKNGEARLSCTATAANIKYHKSVEKTPINLAYDCFIDWVQLIVFFLVRPQLIFEAKASESVPFNRRPHGYIAIDNIDVTREDVSSANPIDSCLGHCNFDGGFCGWSNVLEDDFNWNLVRLRLISSYGENMLSRYAYVSCCMHAIENIGRLRCWHCSRCLLWSQFNAFEDDFNWDLVRLRLIS